MTITAVVIGFVVFGAGGFYLVKHLIHSRYNTMMSQWMDAAPVNVVLNSTWLHPYPIHLIQDSLSQRRLMNQLSREDAAALVEVASELRSHVDAHQEWAVAWAKEKPYALREIMNACARMYHRKHFREAKLHLPQALASEIFYNTDAFDDSSSTLALPPFNRRTETYYNAPLSSASLPFFYGHVNGTDIVGVTCFRGVLCVVNTYRTKRKRKHNV